MDRAAIKTLIQAGGYGSGVQDEAAQDQAITAALLELASDRDWSWLEASATGTLTVGDEEVPSPADLAYPRAVRLSLAGDGFDPLEEMGADHVVHYLHIDDGTDNPDRWAWYHKTIIVYPRPDLAYTYVLDYIKEPDLTAFDTDLESPDFATQFHVVLAWGAMRWLATRQRDWTAKAAYDAEWAAAKLSFANADIPAQSDRVAHWPGWGTVEQ